MEIAGWIPGGFTPRLTPVTILAASSTKHWPNSIKTGSQIQSIRCPGTWRPLGDSAPVSSARESKTIRCLRLLDLEFDVVGLELHLGFPQVLTHHLVRCIFARPHGLALVCGHECHMNRPIGAHVLRVGLGEGAWFHGCKVVCHARPDARMPAASSKNEALRIRQDGSRLTSCQSEFLRILAGAGLLQRTGPNGRVLHANPVSPRSRS